MKLTFISALVISASSSLAQTSCPAGYCRNDRDFTIPFPAPFDTGACPECYQELTDKINLMPGAVASTLTQLCARKNDCWDCDCLHDVWDAAGGFLAQFWLDYVDCVNKCNGGGVGLLIQGQPLVIMAFVYEVTPEYLLN